MRNKLITLSYIFNGDVIKMKQAIDCDLEIRINHSFIKKLKEASVEVITILDSEYPKSLLELYNPPYVLYCMGDIELLNKKRVAIIGSRNNLSYSEDVCKRLVRGMNRNTVIVSGLAKGIDSFAHRYAMLYNKSTIAVIGSGFNRMYPLCNHALAKEISENHLLISEYPLDVKADRRHFPLRNRIIAALASDVYVIEAAKKSGSLITANIALDLGKNIYCAPGSLFEENYEGSHQLINDGAYLLEFRNEV